MRPQPSLGGRRVAIGQKIDGTMMVEVDGERTPGAPVTPGPVVDADCPRSGNPRQGRGVHEAQQRRGARRHGESRQQARTGSSVDGQADALLRLGEASGSSGVRSQEKGGRKAECASGTGGTEAAQTPDGEVEPNGSSKGG